jgi:hypothetical protein
MGRQIMSTRRSRSFTAKPDLVSTTLIYPMTLTTETNTVNAGLTITANASSPLSQNPFQVQNSAGTILWSVPVAGGPKTNGKDARAYNSAGTKYVAYNGQNTPQYYEYYDGTSSYKLWSGIGAPSSDTVGTASAGDYYWRRATYDYPIMVGKSVSIGAVTANRYQSVTASNNQVASSSENNVESVLPAKALFSQFKMVLATAPGASVTRTEALRYNGGASSLAFTIADPATSGSDTTHTAITYPDNTTNKTISIASSANATPTASLAKWRLLQTAPNQHLYSTTNAATSASAVRYVGIQDAGIGTTAASVAQIFPDTGKLVSFTACLSVSAGAGSYTVTLYKGTFGSETATSISFTLTGTSPQLFSPYETSIDVAPNDSLYWQITPNNTPTVAVIELSMEYASSTAGNYVLLGGNGGANVSNTATSFNNWYGNAAWNATEANVQALGYATTLKALYARLNTDTGAAKTRTCTFRINGADTAGTVTFNNTGTTKNWTGSVSIATDDNICVSTVPTGTPTAANMRYSLCLNASITSTATMYVCTVGGSPGTWGQVI